MLCYLVVCRGFAFYNVDRRPSYKHGVCYYCLVWEKRWGKRPRHTTQQMSPEDLRERSVRCARLNATPSECVGESRHLSSTTLGQMNACNFYFDSKAGTSQILHCTFGKGRPRFIFHSNVVAANSENQIDQIWVIWRAEWSEHTPSRRSLA